MRGDEGISAERPRPGLPSRPEPPTCGVPSATVPRLRRGSALPPGPPPSYPLPQRQRGCGGGEGQRARRGRRGGDAAVAPRGTGSKSAPARGGSKSGRRPWRSGWRDGGPSKSSQHPGRRRYLILDVLLPPLRSDVRGEVLSELHPDVSPSLPLRSSSSRRRQRRRRRQQRFRLLPTWAPARRGAGLSFSPPPPPPRSPQSRPPAIFLLLSIAPPRSAHYTSSPW